MKTITSAIAVIRNSGRILLTWDDEWDCWLLPNQTIHEPDTPDHALRSLAIDYLPCMPTRLYDIPPTLMVDSHKPCPQHDDAIRHYVYTIGFYDIYPDADYRYEDVYNHHLIDIDDWQGECDFYGIDHFMFDIGIEPDRHDCTWWTIDEMRADPRMRAVNGDLIGTLELIEAGLLPAPSMVILGSSPKTFATSSAPTPKTCAPSSTPTKSQTSILSRFTTPPVARH